MLAALEVTELFWISYRKVQSAWWKKLQKSCWLSFENELLMGFIFSQLKRWKRQSRGLSGMRMKEFLLTQSSENCSFLQDFHCHLLLLLPTSKSLPLFIPRSIKVGNGRAPREANSDPQLTDQPKANWIMPTVLCLAQAATTFDFHMPWEASSVFLVTSCASPAWVYLGENVVCVAVVCETNVKKSHKKKAVEEKIQIARKEKRLGKRLSLNQAQSVFGAWELKCFVCTISHTKTMWWKSGSHWFSLCMIQAWNGWSWGQRSCFEKGFIWTREGPDPGQWEQHYPSDYVLDWTQRAAVQSLAADFKLNWWVELMMVFWIMSLDCRDW